jgi:hypothetical protein
MAIAELLLALEILKVICCKKAKQSGWIIKKAKSKINF